MRVGANGTPGARSPWLKALGLPAPLKLWFLLVVSTVEKRNGRCLSTYYTVHTCRAAYVSEYPAVCLTPPCRGTHGGRRGPASSPGSTATDREPRGCVSSSHPKADAGTAATAEADDGHIDLLSLGR